MSFTVICFATALACIILGIGLGLSSESHGWIAGVPALLFVAVAAVSLIFGVASYNENLRATIEREKATCLEEGNETIRYNGADYCVAPGSKIIRML